MVGEDRSFVAPWPCRAAAASSSISSQTMGLDRELGIHERGRSMRGLRRASVSWLAGEDPEVGVVAGLPWDRAGSVFSLAGKEPSTRVVRSSGSESKDGTSKAGRLGRLLQLRLGWCERLRGGFASWVWWFGVVLVWWNDDESTAAAVRVGPLISLRERRGSWQGASSGSLVVQ